MFKNKTVVIVAGGRSLIGFDFNLLRGHNVIAVNRAFAFTQPKVVCFWDGKFYEYYQDQLDNCGAKLVSITQGLPLHVRQYPPEAINGNVNNSGHFAIAVALDMRAEWILLLGYDMRGRETFYGYPEDWKRAENSEKIAQFDCYAGERIINCTPNSALPQFPKMEINNALKYFSQ